MSITDGVAEHTLGVTGISTPGLTPHAQAEAPWMPVWTVDGDYARWSSWGWTDDGEWRLEAEPESAPGTMPRLEVTVSELGMYRAVRLCPESALAMMAACREWLASLDEMGVSPEPKPPKLIYDDDPLARRMVRISPKSATLRGVAYRWAASIESWVKEDTR